MLSLPVFFVRNILGNLGQIAVQYAAKLIQRVGAHAAVFSQPVKLPVLKLYSLISLYCDTPFFFMVAHSLSNRIISPSEQIFVQCILLPAY